MAPVKASPTPTTRSAQRPPPARGTNRDQDDQDRVGNAAVQQQLKGSPGGDLQDLTASQALWIEQLRILERLNPKASTADLAMALSLEIWSAGQMWDQEGKSSYPGLILDYEGGKGYKDVRFEGERGQKVDRGMLRRGAVDAQGDTTNVNHAFPAVAAQAGRGWLSAEYASFMATSGGDTLQNTGASLTGDFSYWNLGEYIGNVRAEKVADQVRGNPRARLSDLLLQHFRSENKE